jgi:hypothetical protein
LKKENKNIKFVSEKWLYQCARNGRIVEVGKYLMEKESSGHTEDENQNNQNVQIDNIFPLQAV